MSGFDQLPVSADQELENLIREKAEFCLSTGIQPSEYDAFTDQERNIFVETWNAIVRRNNRG